MQIYELVIEMKLLQRRLTMYEEKYGVLSQDFYAALTEGRLERCDEYDESRADFSRWKGTYETWLRRKQAYDEVEDLEAFEKREQEPSLDLEQFVKALKQQGKI